MQHYKINQIVLTKKNLLWQILWILNKISCNFQSITMIHVSLFVIGIFTKYSDWLKNSWKFGVSFFLKKCFVQLMCEFYFIYGWRSYLNFFVEFLTNHDESCRVSVQGVKSLCCHFACLCRGFDFYEVKKTYYYFSKRKGKHFYTFNHFYTEIAQIY